MRDSLLKNAAAAVVGLVIAVVVIEIFFYAAPNFLPRNVRFVSTSVFDDELRQWFKPNIDTLQVLDDGVMWKLKTTDLGLGGIGFRDDGIQGEPYAVVVGDSHVYGHGVDADRSWVEVLEQRTGRDFVNMGQPAAFPATQEKILERYGARLGPKLVIFSVFQNDWADAASLAEEAKGGSFTNAKRVLDSYSSTYRLARFVANIGKYRSQDDSQKFTEGNVSFYVYQFHLGAVVDDRDPTIEYGERSFNESVMKAADFSRDRGHEIVFVIWPSREQIYIDRLGEFDGSKGANVNRLNDVMLDLCASNNLDCVDLTPAFAERRGSLMFYPIDGHPNADGHALAADVVQNFLKERELV